MPPAARKKRPRSTVSTEANLRNARVTGWITAGVLALFLFASVISFHGLSAIGGWVDLPDVLNFTVPGAVDLAIIVYKFAEIRLRQDDRKAHLAWKAKIGVLAFTSLSSFGNVLSVLADNNKNPVEFYGGMIFAGFMPWMIYLAATVLTDMIVKPKPKRVPKPKLIPAQKAPARRRRVTETLVMDSPQVDNPVETSLAPARSFTLDREIETPMKSWDEA